MCFCICMNEMFELQINSILTILSPTSIEYEYYDKNDSKYYIHIIYYSLTFLLFVIGGKIKHFTNFYFRNWEDLS